MRAYAVHRPLGMGTYPSQYKRQITKLINFETLRYIEEIHHNAFGYIEFEDGSIPKADLDRYELWTNLREDRNLVAAGRTLAKCAANEQWGKYIDVWNKAHDKFGYTDDQLERAMSWFES